MNRAAAAAAASVIATRLPVLLVGAVVVTLIGTIPPPVAEALWRDSSSELGSLL